MQRSAKIVQMMGPDATELVLIRHGETAWNVDHRLQGQCVTAPGLNDLGRRQSQALAQSLAASQTFDAIYSSDLARTTETAHIIADALRAAKGSAPAPLLGQAAQQQQQQASQALLPVFTDAALRERHVGVLQGLTFEEACSRHPDAWAVMSRYLVLQRCAPIVTLAASWLIKGYVY